MTRKLRWSRTGAGLFLAVGLGVAGWVSAAWAYTPVTVTLGIAPDTGLTGGQSVTLSASGLAKSSPGNILECNNDPNEPYVALGSPVSSDVSVGCTAPALTSNAFTSTSAKGVLSKKYVVSSGTIGPPCGKGDLVATCPATDSNGVSPSTDAANYPCPPTAAQQALGYTCVLTFGDQAGDSASGSILFQGESTGTTSTTAPPTTTPHTTTTTSRTTATTSRTTATTAAKSKSSTSTTTAGHSTTTTAPKTGSHAKTATTTTTPTTKGTTKGTTSSHRAALGAKGTGGGSSLPLIIGLIVLVLAIGAGVVLWLRHVRRSRPQPT